MSFLVVVLRVKPMLPAMRMLVSVRIVKRLHGSAVVRRLSSRLTCGLNLTSSRLGLRNVGTITVPRRMRRLKQPVSVRLTVPTKAHSLHLPPLLLLLPLRRPPLLLLFRTMPALLLPSKSFLLCLLVLFKVFLLLPATAKWLPARCPLVPSPKVLSFMKATCMSVIVVSTWLAAWSTALTVFQISSTLAMISLHLRPIDSIVGPVTTTLAPWLMADAMVA